MIRRVFVLLAVSFALAACGVKTDLFTPDGKKAPEGQHDPSKPPHPLGQ